MRPFGLLAIFFIVGIFIASIVNIPFFYVYICCGLFLLAALLSVKKSYFSFFLLAASLLLGFLVYKNSVLLPDNHIKNFPHGFKLSVTGTVASDVERGTTIYGGRKTTFVTQAESLHIKEKRYPVTGPVRTYIYGRAGKISYGDILKLEGRLLRPKEGYYAAYMERNNIYSMLTLDSSESARVIGRSPGKNPLKELAFYLREKISIPIARYLKGEEAALLNAMLLGKREGPYYDLRDAFVKTGTVHVLAISGLHVGLVAFILHVIFSALRLNGKLSTLFIIFVLILYVFITGSRVPVIRASTMIGIMLAGTLFNRRPSSLNSLGLAAMIILLVNPKQLFSPGFQLSFTAVFSILYLTPKIDRFLRSDLLPSASPRGEPLRYVFKLFSISLAAWIGTLPIVAYYFHIISPIAIFGNLIVVPLTFLVIASSLSFIVFYFLMKPLGVIFAAASAGLIESLQFIVDKLSSAPFAYFKINEFPVFVVAIYYAIILVACYNIADD